MSVAWSKMSIRGWVVLGIAVAGLFAMPIMSLVRQDRLLKMLPPTVPVETQADALILLGSQDLGEMAFEVKGTGSMAPYIRGGNPAETVAYAVIDSRGYGDIRKGDLLVYAPAWGGGGYVLHQAVSKDKGGWIMEGLANKGAETWERLTPDKFIGIVSEVITWE